MPPDRRGSDGATNAGKIETSQFQKLKNLKTNGGFEKNMSSLCVTNNVNLGDFKAFLEKLRMPKGKKLYIFGTGNTTLLYQEGLSRIGFDFEGYVCNFTAGQKFLGKKVYSPLELSKMENVCVLLCSTKLSVCTEIGRQLTGLGIEWYHIDEFIFGHHKEEIEQAYSLLEDDTSKELYYRLLDCRVKCQSPDIDIVSPSLYFALPPFMYSAYTEVFIDCGAFVGDSLERYIWQCDGVFKKIIAFEPDSGSYSAMQNRVERLKKEWNISDNKMELYPYAVGEKKIF